MILEGLVTTLDPDGSAHIAPMGPLVDDSVSRLELRPFQTAATYRNLCRTRQGVFHVTDDVEMLARAAVDRLPELPPLLPAASVEGWILAGACRWYTFRVLQIDDREPRSRLSAEVVESGRLRDFFGFNRAKHAVVEAAILATRTAHLASEEIRAEIRRLAVLVEKTGGQQERRAFAFLDSHIAQALDTAGADSWSGAPPGPPSRAASLSPDRTIR